MNSRVIGLQHRIDALSVKATTPPVSGDLELQADLSRHLCVLASGLIERWVISTLEEFSSRKGAPQLVRFATQFISRLQNAKFEDILVLVGRFDPSWRDHFEASVEPEVKAAIDSIVNNRNQIAHGQQVGLSIVTFQQYYKSMKTFLIDFAAFIAEQ